MLRSPALSVEDDFTMKIPTILSLALVCLVLPIFSALSDGLPDYIKHSDSYSNVTTLPKRNLNGLEVEPITFTSHKWRDSEWNHLLLIVHPRTTSIADKALLVIGGGSTGDDIEKRLSSDEAKLALETASSLGITTAVLFNVPNQPLFDGKSEDVLLATSLAQYRNTGDATWPLLLPMVTSAVRAMDLISDRISSDLKFIVTGASKRGWTTFLTGAVDERVIGIAPAVFEMINIPAQINLARERYGKDSEMIKSYTALRLTDDLDSPPMQKLRSWIDPISYERLKDLPKLMLLGSNDPYWVVDSHSLYLPHFNEPKLVTMLPNVGHGVLASQMGRNAITQFTQMVQNHSFPRLTWKTENKDGSMKMRVGSNETISKVRVWIADSATSDFRQSRFHESGIQAVDSMNTEVSLGRGTSAWRVGFVEVWLKGRGIPFSSEAIVLH